MLLVDTALPGPTGPIVVLLQMPFDLIPLFAAFLVLGLFLHISGHPFPVTAAELVPRIRLLRCHCKLKKRVMSFARLGKF